MEINRDNYEEHFLDYWEKKLDKNSTELLMAFIEKNNDLQEEFWSFENILLIPEENISYANKSAFKRPEISEYRNINESNYQHYFVSFIEKDLSGQDEKDVNEFISLNPFLSKEFELFKKTVISSDTTVVFPGKESLKKNAVIKLDFRRTFYWSVSAAASIAIAIVAYFVFNSATNEKYEVVRLIHEKKVDNYRTVVLPESYKKQEDLNNENYTNHNENNDHNKNIINPVNDYKIDEMAAVKRIQIENYQAEPDAELFTELNYSDNLEDYISFIKRNGDLKFASINKKMNLKDEKNDKRFTFWDVAEAGVKGYNVIANKKVNFKTEKDNEGKLTYIALGKNFGYSKSKR